MKPKMRLKRFIGVDLHKNNFTVCFMVCGQGQGQGQGEAEKAEKEELRRYRVSQQGIASFKQELKPEDEVAVECTGNSGYFIRQIEGLVKSVKLVNPMQFKVISSSVKKTDEQDATTIARYLSKGLIPEVRMKSKEESQLSSLIGTRDKLVKLRSALKNKIHNILNANGIVTKREMLGTEKGLGQVLMARVESAYKFELRILVEQIQSLNKAIQDIDKELKDRGQQLKGHKNLTSITGIGDISATILLNTIGKIEDFEDDKKLAAYLGIVPKVYQSNETIHHGRITKMGNKIARTALVQCTLIAIRYNEYLKSFYLKLKSKKGSGKAIIATARKFLTIIYRTLKNGWVFEDFNQFRLVKLAVSG